jgi:hypothetical protein
VLVAVSLAVLAGTLKPVGSLTYWRRNNWTWVAAGGALAAIGLAIAAPLFGLDVLYVVAVVVGVGAVVLWAIGVFRPSGPHKGLRVTVKDLQRAGIAAFLIGMAAVLAAIVLSSRDEPRPSIAASVKEGSGTEFMATVKAAGLSAGKRVEILVEGILPPRRRAANGALVFYKGRPIFDRAPLYDSVLGPNSQGEVDSHVRLPLVKGFDRIQIRAWVGDTAPDPCLTINPNKASPGCVTVRVPGSDPLPQLTTTWEHTTAGVDLRLHITAHDIPLVIVDTKRPKKRGPNFHPIFLPRPTLVSVRITSLRPRGHVLYSALLAPDGRGSLDDTVRIPIVGSFTAVCAAARLLPPPGEETAAGPVDQPTKPACAHPQQAKIQDPSTVWARLVLPSSPPHRDP